MIIVSRSNQAWNNIRNLKGPIGNGWSFKSFAVEKNL